MIPNPLISLEAGPRTPGADTSATGTGDCLASTLVPATNIAIANKAKRLKLETIPLTLMELKCGAVSAAFLQDNHGVKLSNPRAFCQGEESLYRSLPA